MMQSADQVLDWKCQDWWMQCIWKNNPSQIHDQLLHHICNMRTEGCYKIIQVYFLWLEKVCFYVVFWVCFFFFFIPSKALDKWTNCFNNLSSFQYFIIIEYLWISWKHGRSCSPSRFKMEVLKTVWSPFLNFEVS